jgi:hypothetical protein
MADERSTSAPGALAELTGLHGPFVFSELLLQRVWQRGDFDQRGLRLRDGRRIELIHRGRWNRGGGPDFAEAEIRIEEPEGWRTERGAIEAHLRAREWEAHRHAADPAYAGVVLHVVLFPAEAAFTSGAGGRQIPILELLPRLERDLEAIAEEAAVEGLAGRPYGVLRERFAQTSVAELRAAVARHAARRWQAKVTLAARRLARLGWVAACHEAALETLGYRANRAAMRTVAAALPYTEWFVPDAAAKAWAAAQGEWSTAATRPANHPRRRLSQYAEWMRARPDWPQRLAKQGTALAATLPFLGSARERRRHWRIGAWRAKLSEELCAGALPGTRFDTLVCDALLPLLAAQAEGDLAASAAYARLWLAWPPGDVPAELLRLAREYSETAADGVAQPIEQGEIQGLLGWLAVVAPPPQA